MHINPLKETQLQRLRLIYDNDINIVTYLPLIVTEKRSVIKKFVTLLLFSPLLCIYINKYVTQQYQ